MLKQFIENTEDDQWKQATMKLSNGVEMSIIHNIPTDDEAQSAFTNWLFRYQHETDTKEQAEISLSRYINSKNIHYAVPAHMVESLQ